MAITKTIQATVKNRTDTAANWTSKNPVLAEGEIIVVQTSAGETRLKIGDGVKTFTQLPYTDEQIYNNVVTSVNGETGDITMNSVEYTPQTLTDAQKKQARENVDASISDFSFTATIQDFPTCTLDKTFNQIQEAISKGKRVFAFLKISDDESYILTLWKSTSTEIQFAAFDYNYDLNRAQAYKLSVSADKSELAAGSAVMLTAANTLNQVEMAAGPSFDMEIATKKYVDDHVSADVYVDFWPTGSEQYNGNFNGYQVELATDQTFDAIFDSIKAGNKVVARLYKDADKSEETASSVDASVTGTKEFGAIHFQFVTANADTGAIAGFPFIGEAIMMIKMEEAAVSYLIENRNILPTPNADGTDNGKVPIINGTKWELKTPFVINASLNSNGQYTLDKTYAQIREAVTAGNNPVVHFEMPDGAGTAVMPLVEDYGVVFVFRATISIDTGVEALIGQYIISINSDDKVIFKTASALSLNSDGNLTQQTMDRAPTDAMQIATKQYVDGKISDKEIILSSSTTGSTKKFKLTIDDTGTLTASEITA